MEPYDTLKRLKAALYGGPHVSRSLKLTGPAAAAGAALVKGGLNALAAL